MQDNPFEVTKAVDFTDEEIAATWVDLRGGGFVSLADPRSPMATFLVGGKGGGRTHLLRYFSFALQQLRHRADILSGVRSEGYVGIYFRCGGLNSSRFAGKGQEGDTWSAVFSYYTEIWLASLASEVLAELVGGGSDELVPEEESAFTASVLGLFNETVTQTGAEPRSVAGLVDLLRAIQRELDVAINNAALTRDLHINIAANPGRLVFGLPAAAARHFPALGGIKFAYLIDEFENLTADQQRYVNTLLREKSLPATFLIGSRRYGLRTMETLSAGEENRQGSEYDQLVLEDAYRRDPAKYTAFCQDIVTKRLEPLRTRATRPVDLRAYFASPGEGGLPLEARADAHLRERQAQGDSGAPWLERLKSQMERSWGDETATQVALRLAVPGRALHEKFAVFLFYRQWADGADPFMAAEEVKEQLAALEAEPRGRSDAAADRIGLGTEPRGRDSLEITYKHYRSDLYAQLLHDMRRQQEYFGLDDFVRMSGYLPRNLLVVLKQVTRWSLFLGERPFTDETISFRAQAEGVGEASEWFLSDAKGLGPVGEAAQGAVRRLGSLFREMRFSDKPVEVSCAAFATDRDGLSSRALETLDEAVAHSLLLEVPTGRRDKNTRVLHRKYQLNPMLCPQFDLSLALRGSASFSASDLNAIFDPRSGDGAFANLRRKTLARLNAPFSRRLSNDDLFSNDET